MALAGMYVVDSSKGNQIVSTLKTNPSRLAQPGNSLVERTSSWRSGKTSGQRGYDYEWQCYRRDYLAEHPLCAIKGEGCTLAATVVDHVLPHRGNVALFRDPDNHQPACAHCHSQHKQKMEGRGS
jgi:5-methylcytosine-specific restriction enzyme A